MGGQDRSHRVDPRPPEDGVVGGLDVENTKLYDDIERIRVDWELDRARGTDFTPVKIVGE